MTARRLCYLVALLVSILTSAPVNAQDANDLIRLVARNLLAGDWAILNDSSQLWAKGDGANSIEQLQRLGRIENVVGTTDDVVGSTWLATGRAIHQNGASDWRLVFSADITKIVRIELTITFIPDQLPELPKMTFRGESTASTSSPESLKPCKWYPDLCASQERGEVDPRVVEFLFATTRGQTGTADHVEFSGERSRALVLGAARVRVPEDHHLGRIELPGNWLLNIVYESKPDQKKHFIIQSVRVLSQSDWDGILSAKKADEALIFVHGYNTSFDDSLYRMAQIVWDLQYQGVAVLYSWASRGSALSYAYDRESALIDSANFVQLLKMLESEHGISRVHVLAHSMGNLVVMEGLKEQINRKTPVHVSELMLAAPDVDGDYFTLNAPKVRQVTAGMTLYASSADKALILSRKVAGGIPRAGDVPTGGPIILPQMESIDVTAVGSDILGLDHDTFAGTRSVMTDIHELLTDDPRRLPSLRSIEIRGVPEGVMPPRYFRFAE